MANGETSRLLENSKEYRDDLIAKNSDGYTPGNEYSVGHVDTLSDGDNRGREEDDNTIGTLIDIEAREKQLARNSCLFTTTNQYTVGGRI